MPWRLPAKRKNESVGHTLNWGNILAGDTISTSTWDTEGTSTGLTIGSESNTTTTTTAQFSAGEPGAEYLVVNKITTAAGDTLERVLNLRVDATGVDTGGGF